MTAGNQHSENNNEQKKKATIKQKTNKMLKLYHARGVFQSSVSWVTMDGAPESCCGDGWVNRVRLDSDRASTDCWQRPCPVSCCKSGVCEPPETAPNTRARSRCDCPPPTGRRAHISPSKRQMAK